jgi:NAD(P)-dependent dehydrogenase (short-subunit alcohol dehydrogenase family)
MPAETPRNTTSHFNPALIALAACAGALVGLVRRSRSSFKGRTVVITGGSRGLGLALARLFAAEGARLALLARSPDQLTAARRELAARGADVLAVRCDIRDRTAVDAAVNEIARQFGAIDVLVNNAGVIQVTPFEHARLEDFRDSLDTHFWGPLYLIKACLPLFEYQGGGRIINIASIGGRVAVPHLMPYTVGKFALVGFSEALRAELKRYGVTVTTVTPHLMRTGSHRNVLVRGQHAKEATWFALGTATRLTAINAERAARQIVEGARAGRSTISPGWMGRAATLTHAIAPGLASALAAAAVRFVLPSPSTVPSGGVGFDSHEVDLGRRARWFATDVLDRFNQRPAPDETPGT